MIQIWKQNIRHTAGGVMRKAGLLLMLFFIPLIFGGCSADPVLASSLSELLTGMVVPALVTLTGVFTIFLIRKAEQKFGIEITATQEERIRKVAEDAVRFAAEIAAARAKSAGSDSINSESKKTIAVRKVLEAIPEITTKQANDAIHAALARVGEGATVAK